MSPKTPKNAPIEPHVLSLDLVDDRDAFMAMSIRKAETMFELDGEPIPVTVPKGCIGFILAFDSEEAAAEVSPESQIIKLRMQQ